VEMMTGPSAVISIPSGDREMTMPWQELIEAAGRGCRKADVGGRIPTESRCRMGSARTAGYSVGTSVAAWAATRASQRLHESLLPRTQGDGGDN
jgi:hypothetical protein